MVFSSFRGVALTNCDGQDKNNMSPHRSGGRHKYIYSSKKKKTEKKNNNKSKTKKKK
jgi:hypothetical protein